MPNTVTPMHVGTLRFDKSILTAGVDVGKTIAAPSISFLIEGDFEASPIVVDTGFGDLDLMAERQPAFDCSRPHGHSVAERLAHHGYDVDEVGMVFLSHLHWDHCYNLEQFADAGVPIRVPREELEYAVAPYPFHAGGYEAPSLGRTPPWMGLDLDPITGETELAPGVTAFPTPGHAVGHYSLDVETNADPVRQTGQDSEANTVIAVDAIPTDENLAGTDDLDFVLGGATNDRAWWDSANEIVRRADEILPGHEWRILDVEKPPDAV